MGAAHSTKLVVSHTVLYDSKSKNTAVPCSKVAVGAVHIADMYNVACAGCIWCQGHAVAQPVYG